MLRRILNSKNEAIVILNNYFKGGVGKSKLSTMFAYLTDKFNLKVLMIDKDLQATLTKDLAKTFKVELPRVNFYEGLKNGNLASSIVHLTDNLDLIPGTFDLMLLPKLTRSWTFENESNKVSTWSKNGITEHKGYDKKVLSMYENVFFEMLERIIQLENEKE